MLQGAIMRRRKVLCTLASAAVWPEVARAQRNRMRRIGVLMPYPPTDTAIRSRVDALQEELLRLGWSRGNNIDFDERWTTDNLELIRVNAANLVELKPDVIVALGGRVIPTLLKITQAVPIVVPGAVDPVGTGWVKSLAQPGGNVTGFTLMEFSMFGKILDLLKQIAPKTIQVGLVFNPENPSSLPFRRQIEVFAGPLGIEPVAFPIHGLADIDRALATLASQPNTAAFFLPDVSILPMASQVVELVRQRRLPTIFTDLIFAKRGGLLFYGVDRLEIFRRAASYVHRILNGENPGALPFQQPTKYRLVINLKTAIALGLEVPQTLLTSADEVIE
jgi:putative ABC transport system substrate-binding protein